MSRKSGRLRYREPNGRLQRERETAPAEIRRLREAALAGLRDPLWGTQIGRLHLEGKITESQMAAGKKWAVLAGEYGYAILIPSEFPEMMNFDRSHGHPTDVDSISGKQEAERHRTTEERFLAAHSKLTQFGREVERVVRSVCERDEAPLGYQSLVALSFGLSTLADHWELTAGRKSVNVR